MPSERWQPTTDLGRASPAFSCRILDTSPYRAGAYQSREVQGVIRPDSSAVDS
jgi:hypothetical protein